MTFSKKKKSFLTKSSHNCEKFVSPLGQVSPKPTTKLKGQRQCLCLVASELLSPVFIAQRVVLSRFFLTQSHEASAVVESGDVDDRGSSWSFRCDLTWTPWSEWDGLFGGFGGRNSFFYIFF